MGYETSMYVVHRYSFHTHPPMGEELAHVELCKCDDGPVGKLISSHTHKAVGDPPFALFAWNPDRQQEAVEVIRRYAGDINLEADYLNKLSDDIEDGSITKDRYGDFLGVIKIDDMIAALEAEEDYCRFRWALALLKSIRESFPDSERDDLLVITYGH